ncbi:MULTISPECIES: glycosyltransferase [Pectobacterium]|uniref:glycosyltransferase n=1 Tax=Pectobacterium TaxID=122277 RepID=UPI0015DDB5C0|nr:MULTISPECIES: glycosyltransferase [Pectobacterium]MBA0165891.1 galactosyltransferase Lgt5 [Pectobacterium sp. CFBP8739]MCH5051444.1 galactosyltransferase Lgt5 [Pectobacterium aquaticum]
MNHSDIFALWIGEKLGPIEYCCLKSFVMRGHRVFLYAYTHIENLPLGVYIENASTIVPKEKIFRHKKTGSYAIFSDHFRYELLKKRPGIYVDCDVYCIEPVDIPSSGYLLGYEEDNKINGAILSLPQNSKLLNSLINISKDKNFIPPWYEKKLRRKLFWKKSFGKAKHVSDLPWGVLGPEAITWYIKEENNSIEIQPIDIFYPLHHRCVSQLFDPGISIRDIVTSRTKCIHLYNEMLKGFNKENINRNCILGEMIRNKI